MTYIAIKDGVFHKNDSLVLLCLSIFSIEITDDGSVVIDGKKQDWISYDMNCFTKHEALEAFCQVDARKISGLEVYKAERLVSIFEKS